MKKYTVILALLIILPQNLKSQDNKGETAAAVAGALLTIGSGIAAMQLLRDQMEQKAVEHILQEFPEIQNFEIKTQTVKGTSVKDLSDAGLVTYEMTDFDIGRRLVLILFFSKGWNNQYGIDYTKVKWKLFDQKEWNKLIKSFVETAARKEIDLNIISTTKFTSQGLKIGRDFVLEFEKMRKNFYYTRDYSDEFKLVFSEGMMGLFLKPDLDGSELRAGGIRGDLVNIKRRAIVRAHNFLNYLDN